MFCQLLLGHVVADFILQSPRLWQLRHNKPVMGVLWHAALFGFTSLILCLPQPNEFALILHILIGITIVTAIHAIVDYIKTYLKNSYKLNNIFTFLADQTLHIVSLYLISKLYYYEPLLPNWVALIGTCSIGGIYGARFIRGYFRR